MAEPAPWAVSWRRCLPSIRSPIVALSRSIAISARPQYFGEFLGRIVADDNKGRFWVQRPPVIYVGFAGGLL